MKKRYYFLIASVVLVSTFAFLQTDSNSLVEENKNNSIAKELEQWDPVRGQWLAESLEAMSANRAIPDRMFPEDLTPYQMISLLPDDLRNRLTHLSSKSDLNNAEARRSESIKKMVKPAKSNCGTMSARTYGDPHMVTFDGARYSFQTVGEFVLTKSNTGMEVQTRQKPQKDDFSLNTAVAMNVGGDRVGIYASDYPDENVSTPIRVNGQPVHVKSQDKYFLPNGGIVRSLWGGDYRVDWPAGESVNVEFRSTSGMRFINVDVDVSACGGYNGLLGNANGNESDDFGNLNDQAAIRIPTGNDVFTGSSREIEQSRLAYIANALGDEFRVTPSTSLFDYPAGKTTHSFTDRSFPREHRTIEEIPEDEMAEARRICQEAAIANNDLNGCIYDQVYLEIEPCPAPVPTDPTAGIVLKPIRQVVANVNPKPSRPTAGGRPMSEMGATGSEPLPIDVGDITEVDKREKELRDQQIEEDLISKREEEERYERQLEFEARERQERLDQERQEAEERAERDRRDREEREWIEKREREAADRAESERREKEREEAEERAERERQEAKDRAEEEEREARRKAEERAKEESERKKREADARRKREAEARKSREEADRKAREEAARRAKEAADRKAREAAAKKSREGGR